MAPSGSNINFINAGEHQHDSDEEGLAELEDRRSSRHNIQATDLPTGQEIFIVEAKSKKRIKLFLGNKGQDNVICAVCGQKGAEAQPWTRGPQTQEKRVIAAREPDTLPEVTKHDVGLQVTQLGLLGRFM
jgi:hypothetical protein